MVRKDESDILVRKARRVRARFAGKPRSNGTRQRDPPGCAGGIPKAE